MDASKNPVYLRAVADAVAGFRRELEAFLELHVVNDFMARGLAPAVLRRNDADPQVIDQVRSRVSQAAGRASEATALTNTYISVQGAGAVDPIRAWETITMPKPVLEASNVLDACDQMLGRLEMMTLRAQAEAPPTIGAEAMHPLVWGAARRLWQDRHFRHAVAVAADALAGHVKSLTGRNDVAETALWSQTFSADAAATGRARLRWPGPAGDRDVKTMNEDLRQFAPGAQLTIRNPASHGSEEYGEQEAIERLAVLSLLARWVDECTLETAHTPT